jgi:hypothetical protein
MIHTWVFNSESDEEVVVTLECAFDEVIDVPLDLQYLIDLAANTPTRGVKSIVATTVDEE